MNIYDATEAAYKNGYIKGHADAKAEIVPCKDCRRFEPWKDDIGGCKREYEENGISKAWREDDFCSYAERRASDGST